MATTLETATKSSVALNISTYNPTHTWQQTNEDNDIMFSEPTTIIKKNIKGFSI